MAGGAPRARQTAPATAAPRRESALSLAPPAMRPAPALLLLAAAALARAADAPPPPGAASIGPSTDPRLASVGYGEAGVEEWRGSVDPISWSPRAFALRGFLTPQECDHLIAKATPLMEASTVVDNESGQSMPSTVRTSTGCFFSLQEDPVIASIERRIALVTGLPEEGGEGLQVLRYAPDGAGSGQKYDPHHDFFHDDYNTKPENGGQRIGGRRGGGGGGAGPGRRACPVPQSDPALLSPPSSHRAHVPDHARGRRGDRVPARGAESDRGAVLRVRARGDGGQADARRRPRLLLAHARRREGLELVARELSRDGR